MTLESTINKNRYVGNGATTQFPFTFKIWKKDQILVYVGNGETEQELSAQCTIEIADSGGTVTFPTAPASGNVIVLRRSMPFIQEDDYRNGTRFDSEEIEDRFDQDCAERQDLLLDVDRAVKVPLTSGKTPEEWWAEFVNIAGGVEEAKELVWNWLQAIGTDAVGTQTPVLADGSTVFRTLGSRFADTVTVLDFGAKGDGATDDTAAIQAAIDTGKRVFMPTGVYVCSRELSLTTQGQKIFGAGAGAGYRGGNYNSVIDFHDQTTLLFVAPADGASARRVRTRVKYRASASDSQDAAMSVCLNVQAEGVVLEDFAIRLKTEVSDADRAMILSINTASMTESDQAFLVAQSANLGADWDVGIFNGCRLNLKLNRVNVIGYHRMANVWVDVTNGSNLPRFADADGNIYPSDNVNSGTDGMTMCDCMLFGGLWGLRVQGAEPKVGEDGYSDAYFDALLGVAVADKRGSFGCSDFSLINCQIYGPQHFSHLRRVDMTSAGDPVADVDKGGAFSIGGMAGNGTGRIHGHKYIGTRFASNAPFNVRVDRSSRDLFIGCTIDNEGQAYDTEGNAVVSSTSTSFNSFVLTDNAQRCRLFGTNGNAWSTYTKLGQNRHSFLSSDSDGEVDNFLCAKTLSLGAFNSGASLDAYIGVFADSGKNASLRLGDTDSAFAALTLYGSSKKVSLTHDGAELLSAKKYETYNNVLFGGSSGLEARAFSTHNSLYSGGSEALRFLSGTAVRSYLSLAAVPDNTLNLGTGSYRWSAVYAGTGTIQTSDERAKTEVESVSDALMRAWGKVGFKVFKFVDAVEVKGASARLHVGVIAQEIQEAFASEGLDAARYGLFCHDSWDEEPAEYDEQGVLVHKELAAGDRYGVRYDECLALECAYQRWRLAQLEERVNQLTSNG